MSQNSRDDNRGHQFLSATRRRNINVGRDARLTRNLLSGAAKTGEIHHNVAAIDARRDSNGIAATLIADRGDIDGGATMTADYVLAVLAIAFRATDAASIESGTVAIGFLDEHETQILIGDVDGEQM